MRKKWIPMKKNAIVKELHVFADEDHVHMQKPNKVKGKKSVSVPLVTVTEGIRSKSGRREAIRMRVSEELPGSCTEGPVSHILSERFSRDPLGWSREGLGKLSKQCVISEEQR